MYQDGITALQMARKCNKQPVVAYLSTATEMRRRREEENKRHEQNLIVELRRLCELGNASAVTDLLRRETATTIACTTALSTAEVGI